MEWLGGILFANLAYPWRNGQNQMLELYALTQIKKKDGKINRIFLVSLWKTGCLPLLFFLLTGLTGAARFIVVVAAAWMGFLAGAAGSLLILELGIRRDSWTFAGSLFPQADCIFSRGCTADDKNLQGTGKYLEETGKSYKNLSS